MNQMDFSSASPSCRLHHQPATLLQKQEATEWGTENRKLCTVSWLGMVLAQKQLKGLLYRQSHYGTPMALPVRWCEPAGSLCCQSNTEPSAHMALTDSVASSTYTHTQTHTSAGFVRTSLQIHTCSLCFIITSLPHTFHTLALTGERVVGLMTDCSTFPIMQRILYLPP